MSIYIFFGLWGILGWYTDEQQARLSLEIQMQNPDIKADSANFIAASLFGGPIGALIYIASKWYNA